MVRALPDGQISGEYNICLTVKLSGVCPVVVVGRLFPLGFSKQEL